MKNTSGGDAEGHHVPAAGGRGCSDSGLSFHAALELGPEPAGEIFNKSRIFPEEGSFLFENPPCYRGVLPEGGDPEGPCGKKSSLPKKVLFPVQQASP